MNTNSNSKLNKMLNSRWLALGLVVIGVALIVFFGIRSVRAYRQLQFIRNEGLDRGTASVDAIRPWMTVQYVGVAYGVPEEYLFAQLDIPFNRRNSRDTLGHLNRAYDFGPPVPGEEPPIIAAAAAAILAYRENPVATGLDDIRPWMTLRYIANSTGVPESHLLTALGIDSEDNNLFKPLDQLAKDIRFEGGPRRLIEHIKRALREYEDGS